LYKHSNLFH